LVGGKSCKREIVAKLSVTGRVLKAQKGSKEQERERILKKDKIKSGTMVMLPKNRLFSMLVNIEQYWTTS